MSHWERWASGKSQGIGGASEKSQGIGGIWQVTGNTGNLACHSNRGASGKSPGLGRTGMSQNPWKSPNIPSDREKVPKFMQNGIFVMRNLRQKRVNLNRD